MSTAGRLARFAHLPVFEPDLTMLPAAQVDLWGRLGDVPESFVLYGGTALALRLAHRESFDFDLFSAEPFRGGDLLGTLGWLGKVEVIDISDNDLTIITPAGIKLSFFGDMGLRAVAEPSLALANGIVVASVFDLAGTKAKALLDRSEWKDYVDIAALLRAGHSLADVIGYATAIFDRLFAFPAPVFLRSLVWFGDGTAPDVPVHVQKQLEHAVRGVDFQDIPLVQPYRDSIHP